MQCPPGEKMIIVLRKVRLIQKFWMICCVSGTKDGNALGLCLSVSLLSRCLQRLANIKTVLTGKYHYKYSGLQATKNLTKTGLRGGKKDNLCVYVNVQSKSKPDGCC